MGEQQSNERRTLWLNGMLLVLLAGLFLPWLQSSFSFVKENPLGGFYNLPQNPTYAWGKWREGSYQKSKENYLKETFGFRKPLLRMRYQWLYSAYAMSRVNEFAVGKEDYVFQNRYIRADQGRDFVGLEQVKADVAQLKLVQTAMKKEGKELLVFITPSKTLYHQEYLYPDQQAWTDSATNYKAYLKELKAQGVATVDLNAWFLVLKDTTTYPLFPKTGIHFSSYGAALAADSLVNYWEQVLGKDLPDFGWSSLDVTHELRDEDGDLEWAMNLWYKIPSLKMAYPQLEIKEEGKYKPRVLTIGDSFFWRFYRWDGLKKIYQEAHSKFLYYNKEVYPGKAERVSYNLAKELEHLDAVCIYINPSQMDRSFWGIGKDLYEYYKSYTEADITVMIGKIKNNPEWYNGLQAEAAAIDQPIEERVRIAAIQFLEEKQNQRRNDLRASNKTKEFEANVKKFTQQIKATPHWLADITRKAKELKIPVDSMIGIDARYMARQAMK